MERFTFKRDYIITALIQKMGVECYTVLMNALPFIWLLKNDIAFEPILTAFLGYAFVQLVVIPLSKRYLFPQLDLYRVYQLEREIALHLHQKAEKLLIFWDNNGIGLIELSKTNTTSKTTKFTFFKFDAATSNEVQEQIWNNVIEQYLLKTYQIIKGSAMAPRRPSGLIPSAVISIGKPGLVDDGVLFKNIQFK